MMQAMQKPINDRQHERKTSNQKIRWMHQYGDSIESNAYDISPWGMFIPSEGKMIEKLNVNDVVTIIINIGKEEYQLVASIRWAGTSTVHSKRGFGLEFDDETKGLAKALLLQLDSEDVFFVPE